MTKISLEVIHEILTRVEKKVDRTNGRVSKLEAWKNRIVGGLIVTNLILLPVAITIFINYIR